jgi:hypothetical protein
MASADNSGHCDMRLGEKLVMLNGNLLSAEGE